jgi:tryptophanyl-tRNA synthetase
MNKQEIIVSGTRPSGILHVGNYLGAFKQWLELQNQPSNKCFFIIVDLHALTTPFEPKILHTATLDFAASFLAFGVDPNKSTLFLQSSVLEHATLAWIFNCLTPLGELERMTEFKDKSAKNEAGINAGLLSYPTLMASDILLYKPTLVPVGEDQTQHLELARSIARKFNNKFGKIFHEPKNYALKPLRLKSLTDPEKKMSKTGDEALLLDDEPKEIMRKIKKAVTASEPGKKSPGVENLFFLLENFGTLEQVNFFREAQRNDNLKFSELKETLAKEIAEYFAEFREKKKELLSKPEYLAEVLGDGSRKAHEVASQTLMEVKQKIGLL